MNTDVSMLTIFTESILESKLLYDLEHLGAPGYTVTNARGKGHQGSRSGAWEASSNIRVEIICQTDFAHQLADKLEQKYYANFAMVTTISPVLVRRPEKFASLLSQDKSSEGSVVD